MAAVFLGIDVGTSATKTLALDETGRVVAKARRTYATIAPVTSWAEQSPDDWWRATCESVREVVEAIGRDAVAGIGLSGQLNGFVLLDEYDQPLGPAIVWLDMRALQEARQLESTLGIRIRNLSGNRIGPISVMAKLCWLRLHRPALLDRTRRILFVKDYLLWRLTGVHATDPSDASATNLMGLADHLWSTELCGAAGIDPVLLPKIIRSTAMVGQVHRPAAAETGLPVGTPVVVGAGDVTALATGCGVIREGILGITLGTAGHVVAASQRPLPPEAAGMWQIAHVSDKLLIWLGLIISGGLSLSWLYETMTLGRGTPSFDEFVTLADSSAPGARGLTFLPFLEGAATPHEKPDARAAFVGLTSSHGAAEMVQAVLEGVAFNLRECVEVMHGLGAQITEVRLAEGGSKVGRWCQVIADVLARPVSLLEEDDTSALGAAIIAQAGIQGVELAVVGALAVRTGRRYEPTQTSQYLEPFDRYRSALRRLEIDEARS